MDRSLRICRHCGSITDQYPCQFCGSPATAVPEVESETNLYNLPPSAPLGTERLLLEAEQQRNFR
jgi:hypothetical protein